MSGHEISGLNLSGTLNGTLNSSVNEGDMVVEEDISGGDDDEYDDHDLHEDGDYDEDRGHDDYGDYDSNTMVDSMIYGDHDDHDDPHILLVQRKFMIPSVDAYLPELQFDVIVRDSDDHTEFVALEPLRVTGDGVPSERRTLLLALHDEQAPVLLDMAARLNGLQSHEVSRRAVGTVERVQGEGGEGEKGGWAVDRVESVCVCVCVCVCVREREVVSVSVIYVW